ILRDQQQGVSIPRIAASFHNTVIHFLAEMARRMAAETQLDRIVLSGGAFQNAYLLEGLTREVARAGLQPILPQRVPPNDGGIALGQVAIAKARLAPS
ncbi:MAG: carbamoyltransferase HypF, partial [candidate division NC10 bacterium]|nr:carbamoyltransferase HypF [candidate division NC10 bacterium]